MDIKEMTVDELQERRAAIGAELDTPDADLDALEAEARTIKEELETRKAEEAKRNEIRQAVTEGAGTVVETFIPESKEERTMTIEEIRSSKEYVDAFANYIKSGKDEECRSLLTVNATSGQVPVPTIVEGRIRTAWEKNGLMNLVRKTYLRGNVQVGFELSATDAELHVEGADAPTEETLTFGIVRMIPQSIKKWITISDEAADLGGEEFLNYIYDELTYRIAKKAEDLLVEMITEAPEDATASAVGVAEVKDDGTDLLGIVAKAFANLSDEAANPVIVMNKLTYAAFIAARNGAEYAVDPFMGLPVYFNNTISTIDDATAGAPWLIVGDFGVGAQANFPNGDEITIKYDDLSLAEQDLVKLVGREFVGMGLVADRAFCRVVPTVA